MNALLRSPCTNAGVRRTPTERDILAPLPANTLEYLAITGCDDAALLKSSMRECPDDPTMIEITSWRQKSALDASGFEGFQSSQL